MRLPIGTIALLVVTVLIYFGVAERLLDRMRLNDKTALLFLGAMLVGTYIPDIPLTSQLAINIGGGVVPLALALWLWFTADEAKERMRALWATLGAGALVYLTSVYLPINHDGGGVYGIIDPLYAYAAVSGLVAYLLGRSRRASFIAGVLGIVINDLIYAVQISLRGVPTQTVIGGAGVFDAVLISGLLAVLLAELVGETRERLGGGHHPRKEEKRSLKLQDTVELNESQTAKIESLSERRDGKK